MVMHKNKLWLGFLAVCIAITLWFSVEALYKIYSFYRLTAEAPLLNSNWTIRKASDEMYIVQASYEFEVEGQKFQGNTEFTRDYYRNMWGAEQAITAFKKVYHRVWYAPSNPRHSSLQKTYPLKECISAGILWVLVLYFLWLGFYVTRYQ